MNGGYKMYIANHNKIMWPFDTEESVSQDLQKLTKILYIGPWHHIEPTVQPNLKHVKEFIYVDSQPRSEVDKVGKYIYKETFVDRLKEKCKSCGYVLMKIKRLDENYYKNVIQHMHVNISKEDYEHLNPCLYEFENPYFDKKIKYYISTNFQKNMCAELMEDMNNSDGIIVSGSFPHMDIFKYFPKPKLFIGYTETVYPRDDSEELTDDCNIINALINNTANTMSHYFNGYYVCSMRTGHMEKCNDIYELSEYSENEAEDYYVFETVELT